MKRTILAIAALLSIASYSNAQETQQDTTRTSIFSVVEVLDEAVATAEKSRVVYRLDRQKVSGNANLAASGGTAVDVLKSIPSVQVNADGELSYRGSTGFLVYVDGRQSVLEGTQALQQISASLIEDIEIICVDDGSTDSSGKICDEYALKDSRVAVYHIENSGLSGARNYGTKHAHGEFIQYLDGDDCLCEGAISSSVAKITDEVDAVICRISYWCSDTDTVTEEPFTFKDEYVEGLRGDDAFANLANMATHQLWSACRPIFRRSVMTDNGFEFRDRLLSQDLDLMPHIYRKCRRIAVNNNSVIKYRTMRKGSISQVGSLKRYLDVFGIIARWDEFIRTDKESSQNFHDAMKRQIELLYVNYLKR